MNTIYMHCYCWCYCLNAVTFSSTQTQGQRDIAIVGVTVWTPSLSHAHKHKDSETLLLLVLLFERRHFLTQTNTKTERHCYCCCLNTVTFSRRQTQRQRDKPSSFKTQRRTCWERGVECTKHLLSNTNKRQRTTNRPIAKAEPIENTTWNKPTKIKSGLKAETEEWKWETTLYDPSRKGRHCHVYMYICIWSLAVSNARDALKYR